jgi:hypothetical protein
MDGEDMAIYEGVDENGFKWELGLVPDDKNPERLALVHAEPILWKRGKL